MYYQVSPNYTSEKFIHATIEDKIDVLEDRVLNGLFASIDKLTDETDMMAVATLCFTYVEMIQQYYDGIDSRGKSKKTFNRGIENIYGDVISCWKTDVDRLKKELEEDKMPFDIEFQRWCIESSESMIESLKNDLYNSARCGFMHSYMHKSKFRLGTGFADYSIGCSNWGVIITLNPFDMKNRFLKHFSAYIARLRSGDSDLCSKFENRFEIEIKEFCQF